MTTTITTDNVKKPSELDQVTALADADVLLAQDVSESKLVGITRDDLQTDIASRSVDDLATLAAITTAGTVLPDGKAVGVLYKKTRRFSTTDATILIQNANYQLYGTNDGTVLVLCKDSGSASSYALLVANLVFGSSINYTVLASNGLTISSISIYGTIAVSGASGTLTYHCSGLEDIL